jgi:hypothetical protein
MQQCAALPTKGAGESKAFVVPLGDGRTASGPVRRRPHIRAEFTGLRHPPLLIKDCGGGRWQAWW